jgi:hypothetical protein
MMGRRGVLKTTAKLSAAGVTAAAAHRSFAGLPVPSGSGLAFRLVRRGSEIGRHTVTFDQRDDALTVRVSVDALVTLVSIPIVRYTHRVTEIWKDGNLETLTGETDKNGQREWVKARRGPEGLVVTGSKTKQYVAPEHTGATSYWNKQTLDLPMISLEDGVLLRPKVTPLPVETVPLASGTAIPADHYNLSGAFNIDLWYDRSNTWASMAFSVADGSTVRYERL